MDAEQVLKEFIHVQHRVNKTQNEMNKNVDKAIDILTNMITNLEDRIARLERQVNSDGQ